jgi:hypothetical protein
MGDFSLIGFAMDVFLKKITEVAQMFGQLFSTVKVMYIYTFFGKKCVGLQVGRFFPQTHLVTLMFLMSVEGTRQNVFWLLACHPLSEFTL